MTFSRASGSECDLELLYTHDQFRPDASNALYLNANGTIPAGQCVRSRICHHPIIICSCDGSSFVHTDALEPNEEDEFDDTEDYLELSLDPLVQTHIALLFDLSATGLHGGTILHNPSIDGARVVMQIVDGEVPQSGLSLRTYPQPELPETVGDIWETFPGEYFGNRRQTGRHTWFEVDVTADLRRIVNDVSHDELVESAVLLLSLRSVSEGSGAVQFASSRHLTAKPPILIIRQGRRH